MTVSRCIEVVLTIPDNEARTALATLQRFALPVGGIERASLFLCEVDAEQAEPLVTAVRGLETIFNPNKHELRIRESELPRPGEVWIAESDGFAEAEAAGPARIAGRALPGLRRLSRFVAWRLFDATGAPASQEIVARATERLLCNPAFQKATAHS